MLINYFHIILFQLIWKQFTDASNKFDTDSTIPIQKSSNQAHWLARDVPSSNIIKIPRAGPLHHGQNGRIATRTFEHVGEDTADPDNPAEPAVDALESDEPQKKQYNFSLGKGKRKKKNSYSGSKQKQSKTYSQFKEAMANDPALAISGQELDSSI